MKGVGRLSRKLRRGEKFHPLEIDLTQEDRGGAKMDINTKKEDRKRLREMLEKLARQWIHL